MVIDGAHHLDPRHWAADLRRQNEIWVAGDRILRFTAFDVRRHPDYVVAQLRAALDASGVADRKQARSKYGAKKSS